MVMVKVVGGEGKKKARGVRLAGGDPTLGRRDVHSEIDGNGKLIDGTMVTALGKKKPTTGENAGETWASFRWRRLCGEAEDGSARRPHGTATVGATDLELAEARESEGLRARDAIPSREHKPQSTTMMVWGGRGTSKAATDQQNPHPPRASRASRRWASSAIHVTDLRRGHGAEAARTAAEGIAVGTG
ncbi:hypothetical protein TIFTF001_006136 [Ficus carica]|uniref:Uncharacterized protein n=1 Tax=Ficus carica TaxID=3494 RepID=A0AA88CVP6_FICCA|nr:hypothetical protein TIFTF001_006136 [Ficus carica]